MNENVEKAWIIEQVMYVYVNAKKKQDKERSILENEIAGMKFFKWRLCTSSM